MKKKKQEVPKPRRKAYKYFHFSSRDELVSRTHKIHHVVLNGENNDGPMKDDVAKFRIELKDGTVSIYSNDSPKPVFYYAIGRFPNPWKI
jgi:hypothetical protein